MLILNGLRPIMTSVSISQELDSSIINGLRLLHSSDPDAEEQLRQLWRQSVFEKYGDDRTPTSVLHKISIPTGVKRDSPEGGDDFAPEVKRPKLESSSTLGQKSTSGGSPQNDVSLLPYSSDYVEINNSSSDPDSDDDSPLEILNVNGICMKCKNSSSSSNNKLVECVDCHKHYHQQCHFPPITDMDLSDPRFVWYCSACEQNITTTTTEKTKSSSSSSASVTRSASSAKNTAAVTKSSSRTYGSSKTSSNSSSKISGDSNAKESSNSSNTPEKKGCHTMKKRPIKKQDKRKTRK